MGKFEAAGIIIRHIHLRRRDAASRSTQLHSNLSESRIIADSTDFKGIFVFKSCLAKTGASEPGAVGAVSQPHRILARNLLYFKLLLSPVGGAVFIEKHCKKSPALSGRYIYRSEMSLFSSPIRAACL